ncbi:hypothetical protein P8452_55292 [Trifolium repens]|nr:hypothetical protein P8452_55292 [Trifolium repens]
MNIHYNEEVDDPFRSSSSSLSFPSLRRSRSKVSSECGSFGTSGVLHLLCVSVPIMCAAGFILVPAPPSWRNFHIFLYPSLMLCYYLVDFLNSHHRKCLAQHHLINLKKAVIATQCAWRGKVAWRELRNLIW